MTRGDAAENSRRAAWLETFTTPLGKTVAVLAGVVLLLLVGMILLTLNVTGLRRDTAGAILETETALAALSRAQEQAEPGWIQADFSDVQPLGWGFLLVDLATEETDEGTTVSGSVINATSLNHYNALFLIMLTDEYTGEFELDTLKSGYSDSFEVTIPGTENLTMPDEVRINYLGSEVAYY
jgi:hypothetical protein